MESYRTEFTTAMLDDDDGTGLLHVRDGDPDELTAMTPTYLLSDDAEPVEAWSGGAPVADADLRAALSALDKLGWEPVTDEWGELEVLDSGDTWRLVPLAKH